MTIWLLGLLLMASLAGLGYRQGAVRVAFSFVAILLGALLAVPLGHLLKPVLLAVGFKNPVLVWWLGPIIVFILISIIFKSAAFPVHQKVDVYFKYRAGDLRLALYERLHRRLGLCLGLFNGAAYFIIICFIIYSLSYWTFQMSTPEKDATSLKLLNRLGEDLQSSGFAKVARSVDHLPQAWYDAADLAGLLYNNPLAEARLSRYPGFLGLAESPEFKDLGSDMEFAQMRAKREPILDLIKYPKVDSMISNPDMVQRIWNTVIPDIQDLCTFLQTAQSPKYDSEKILGRWKLDVNAVINGIRRLKPNMAGKELQFVKRYINAAFDKTSLVAMADHQAVVKNLPALRLPAPNATANPGLQSYTGKWDNAGGKYMLNVNQQDMPATIEGDRLTVTTGTELSLVFNREY